jgi:hypothetical protein
MRRSRIIETLWLSYREQVISPDSPPIQFTECRRAFYAGAKALMVAMSAVLEPGQDVTDDDVQTMESIDQELYRFAEMVKAGEA